MPKSYFYELFHKSVCYVIASKVIQYVKNHHCMHVIFVPLHKLSLSYFCYHLLNHYK